MSDDENIRDKSDLRSLTKDELIDEFSNMLKAANKITVKDIIDVLFEKNIIDTNSKRKLTELTDKYFETTGTKDGLRGEIIGIAQHSEFLNLINKIIFAVLLSSKEVEDFLFSIEPEQMDVFLKAKFSLTIKHPSAIPFVTIKIKCSGLSQFPNPKKLYHNFGKLIIKTIKTSNAIKGHIEKAKKEEMDILKIKKFEIDMKEFYDILKLKLPSNGEIPPLTSNDRIFDSYDENFLREIRIDPK